MPHDRDDHEIDLMAETAEGARFTADDVRGQHGGHCPWTSAPADSFE